MNTFQCFQEYTALKLYFTASYDYMKYGARVKSATPLALERHKNRYAFEKLAKMRDPRVYLISNFLKDRVWSGDRISTEGEQDYKAWKKRNDSLDDALLEELKQHVGEDPSAALTATKGYPLLLKKYLRGQVSIELLLALDYCVNIRHHWDQWMHGDMVWEELRHKMVKYQPFFYVNDLEPFKKGLQEYYADRT